jgi:hypothetical protein
MNIELKNIKVYEKLSEETNCFTGTLFVNGKKLAECENSGKGGQTNIDLLNRNEVSQTLLKEVEDYCQNLPPIKSQWFPEGLSMNLELFVDLAIDTHIKEKDSLKFKKKLQRDMLKGICYGNEQAYRILSWKNFDIASLIRNPKGLDMLRNKVRELIESGETILNTNLDIN